MSSDAWSRFGCPSDIQVMKNHIGSSRLESKALAPLTQNPFDQLSIASPKNELTSVSQPLRPTSLAGLGFNNIQNKAQCLN
ncbi:MAG: hypothetical protein AAF483_28730, partial [Planctomycetota bacterium]